MTLSKTALKTGKYTWHIAVNGNHVATIENATLTRAKRIYASQIEGIKERCLSGKIKGDVCTGVDNNGKAVQSLVHSINLVMEEYDVIIEECGEMLEVSLPDGTSSAMGFIFDFGKIVYQHGTYQEKVTYASKYVRIVRCADMDISTSEVYLYRIEYIDEEGHCRHTVRYNNVEAHIAANNLRTTIENKHSSVS